MWYSSDPNDPRYMASEATNMRFKSNMRRALWFVPAGASIIHAKDVFANVPAL
jgi:hypothetical protein